MTIELELKNVYGNELIYIKDEQAKDAVQTLTGKKTIDHQDINALESLGLTFTGI